MSLSREKIAGFCSVWWIKFRDRVTSGLQAAAVIASIFAFFGLSLVGSTYSLWILGLVLLLLLFWALRSLPRFHVHPSDIAGRKIEIEELERLLTKIEVVGLVGIDETGKTTFLNSIAHRSEPTRRTEKPYCVVIAMPDQSPTTYVAIIDSVGQRYENQFQVMEKADLVCLFLDHNASDRTRDVDDQRVIDHSRFVDQLVRTHATRGAQANSIIVVGNKSDLRRRSPASRESMATLVDQTVNNLRPRFGSVRKVESFSNRTPEDVSGLLREIRDALA